MRRTATRPSGGLSDAPERRARGEPRLRGGQALRQGERSARAERALGKSAREGRFTLLFSSKRKHYTENIGGDGEKWVERDGRQLK